MKRIIALILATALLLGCTRALASIQVEVDGGVAAATGVNYAGQSVSGVIPGGIADIDIKVTDSLGLGIYQIDVYELSSADQSVIRCVDSWNPEDQPSNYTLKYNEVATIAGPQADVNDSSLYVREIAYRVVVTYGSANGPKEELLFYANSIDKNDILISGRSWYPNNHATTFGPKLEGSWMTYSVVDLSIEGTQTLPLVGAGAWNLGNVYISVQGDEVVITYQMHEDEIATDIYDSITVNDEYLNLYADLPDMLDIGDESIFEYGKPFSIQKDLGGRTIVALFTVMQVDFPTHSPYVYRFWPNMPANRNIVSKMNFIWENRAD